VNVGCVAAALVDVMPPRLRALLPTQAVPLLAALHDVGKISPGFQQKCTEWVSQNLNWFHADAGYESRHARVSQSFVKTTSGSLSRLAEAIGAHHGLVQGNDPPGELGGNTWHQARCRLLEELQDAFGALPPRDAASEAVQWLLAGLITVSDWLASDEDNFSAEDRGPLRSDEQRARADAVLQRLDLKGASIRAALTFEAAFADTVKPGGARPLQRFIVEMPTVEPGVYVIEDVMGSGKTEAALWLAYRLMSTGKARGLYFGLPTRVTSDRIHRRVKTYLSKICPESTEPRLIHGQAWLRNEMPRVPTPPKAMCEAEGEDAPDIAVRSWFASSRRGILASFAVGTIDQALLGIVARKWFFVRQFGLAGKVVVLDEVHSYDLYTGTLIALLVRRLRQLGATPVILSATLTARQKAALLGEPQPVPDGAGSAPYPAITIKCGESASRVHRPSVGGATGAKTVRFAPLLVPDFEDVACVAEEAVRLAEAGNNVLWIRNTVNHAQQAYRMLNAEKRADGYEVGLLHSRFPAYQRGSYTSRTLETLKQHHLHEERWLWMLGQPRHPRRDARPKASILVSTQVVEQSVDIDADVLISDLAPSDMLLQRLGRLHRHDRGPRAAPALHIVLPQAIAETAETLSAEDIKAALGKIGAVYAAYVLLRTWQVWRAWRKGETVVLPSDIRELLEATYTDPDHEPTAWRTLHDELQAEKKQLEQLALSATDVRGRPLGPDREGLGTRFSRQRQVLLLLLRWRSRDTDTLGNPREVHLLNKAKIDLSEDREFNIQTARALHCNTVPVPAWWLPHAIRAPLPDGLARYFVEDVAMGVWDQETGLLSFDLRDRDKAPTICYRPDIGVWLKDPPSKGTSADTQFPEDDGEDDDGIF